jgi:serine/threonine-protein kinase ULK/ATG1
MAARAPPSSSRRQRTGDTNVGDRFQIREEIGKGSFATVYKGINRENQSLVAIKSVNLSKLNKKLKENLYSEIQILRTLSHPHVVALLDCKESTSHINLVMEYCELGDLSLFIKKRDKLITHSATMDMARKYPNPPGGGLNEVITRHFLKQLASALQFLRQGNFIHRDIKPQNLLLNPSVHYLRQPGAPLIMSANAKSLIPDAGIESLPMLKLADFGFARSLPQTSLAETLCGSPLYMAPEILRYEKYDAKADLWSVGTVLFEMMTGKPPFRASNHVELLRKIEQGEDVIKFSKESVVSPGMKSLIRGLLKRNPVERMSFENFFGHDVVIETIPGLVDEDREPEAPAVEEIRPVRRPSLRNRSERSSQMSNTKEASREAHGSPSSRAEVLASRGTPPRPPVDRAMTRVPSQHEPPVRPSIKPTATAPNPPTLHEQSPLPRPVAMARKVSRDSESPGSSLLTEIAMRESPRKREDPVQKAEREKAAHDVAFERDYVLVERRAVEVNAFADELAASPRIATSKGSPTATGAKLARRATTQGVPASLTGAVPPSTSRAMQIAQGRQRSDGSHQRQSSWERRYGRSPSSVPSVISKAIQGASLRLFGIGVSPQMLGKSQSPPQLYSPYPAYPTSPGTLGLIGEGKQNAPMDEDVRAAVIIEEAATRSDVVYGFAEVKYKQLVPLTPSADNSLGPKAEEETPDPDCGLTTDAIVSLSEEALVLYVKNLALLAKAMDIAGAWWQRRTRGEIVAGVHVTRPDLVSVAISNRINSVVQWLRTRFNEVLEKAEFVRLRLLAAQRQLPEDHPGHPNNHTSASRFASTSTEGVVLSSGITAEKVLYDRALEMSRAAAVDEIANVDLRSCEISYVTAIRMLEAVLEGDEETSKKVGEKENIEIVMDGDDREAVLKGKSDTM